jgi:hypothetical protein
MWVHVVIPRGSVGIATWKCSFLNFIFQQNTFEQGKRFPGEIKCSDPISKPLIIVVLF